MVNNSEHSGTSATAQPLFRRGEWLGVGLFIFIILALTSLPYIFAYKSAPADMQFMGIMVNVPDHTQYFSWMREAHTQVLVPNQLTPEDSAPLLFNFLWWSLGQAEVITGLDYAALFQIVRWLAGAFVMAATYLFCAIVFQSRTKRWLAFLIGVLGGGVGWIWIVLKYAAPNIPLPDSLSFTLYASEPNTFFNILAFPHFSIAAGLVALVFTMILLGQRKQDMRYAWAAAAVALLLSLQHAYDMFIIYPVIGLYGLFIWARDRRFPMYLFNLGVIVVLVSMWPALQAFLITTGDDVWRGVLSQFDNAGAWTPSPLLLPVLMGFGWLLAIWALDIRTPWRERDDTHLFVMAWFLTHFVIIYLPMNFQIHLLSGWQVVIGVMATIGLYTRVLPLLQRIFRNTSRTTLLRWASIGLIALVIPVNLYLFAWRFIDLRRAEAPYFMPVDTVAAYNYLEDQVTSKDVVLSSMPVGHYVPMLTGARAFLAHWAQTLNFYDKRDMVEAFFNADTDDSERLAILRDYNVGYVLVTPEERALGTFDAASVPYLQEAFTRGEATVYRVNIEADTTE